MAENTVTGHVIQETGRLTAISHVSRYLIADIDVSILGQQQ